jgi:RNA polymerase sigma factor (sigma-70 family)
MVDLNQFLETLGKANNTHQKEGTQDVSPPVWVKDSSDAVIQIYRAWPKHPGTGKPLPFEKCSPGAAATHAVETHYLDPNSPERFLKEWLGLTEIIPEHIEALCEVVKRGLKKPITDPKQWIINPVRAKRYLRRAVCKEAQRIKARREIEDKPEDKPWGLRRQWVEDLPEQCEFKPEVHSTTEGAPTQELVMFQQQEKAQVMQRRFKEILPERQYQAIELKARGLTYEQIASEMGITAGAAKQHIYRARNNPTLKRIAGECL